MRKQRNPFTHRMCMYVFLKQTLLSCTLLSRVQRIQQKRIGKSMRDSRWDKRKTDRRKWDRRERERETQREKYTEIPFAFRMDTTFFAFSLLFSHPHLSLSITLFHWPILFSHPLQVADVASSQRRKKVKPFRDNYHKRISSSTEKIILMRTSNTTQGNSNIKSPSYSSL